MQISRNKVFTLYTIIFYILIGENAFAQNPDQSSGRSCHSNSVASLDYAGRKVVLSNRYLFEPPDLSSEMWNGYQSYGFGDSSFLYALCETDSLMSSVFWKPACFIGFINYFQRGSLEGQSRKLDSCVLWYSSDSKRISISWNNSDVLNIDTLGPKRIRLPVYDLNTTRLRVFSHFLSFNFNSNGDLSLFLEEDGFLFFEYNLEKNPEGKKVRYEDDFPTQRMSYFFPMDSDGDLSLNHKYGVDNRFHSWLSLFLVPSANSKTMLLHNCLSSDQTKSGVEKLFRYQQIMGIWCLKPKSRPLKAGDEKAQLILLSEILNKDCEYFTNKLKKKKNVE